ncbi:MAG: PAS domain-containing protein, partial [Candidatus Paceibacteria bacterium]
MAERNTGFNKEPRLNSSGQILEQKSSTGIWRPWQDFLGLGLCFVDDKGKILRANKAAALLLKKELQNIIGFGLETIFGSFELSSKYHQDVFTKGQARQDFEIFLPDGSRKILRAISSKAKGGKNPGYYLALIDITELKSSQQDLEAMVQRRTYQLQENVKELTDARTALMNILEDVQASRKLAEEERTKAKTIIDNFVEGLLFFDQQK